METKNELISVLQQIEKEKGIKKEDILKVIQMALISAYKKHVGEKVNLEVSINPETGSVNTFAVKKIVEKVTNPNIEISLEEAKKNENISETDLKIDNEIKIPFAIHDFSRIAAQVAKQVIIQKIRESEKQKLYEEFKSKEGRIITGIVYRIVDKNIIVDLGKTESILPYNEQIHSEKLNRGDHIKVLVVKVEPGSQIPRILISRSRAEFIKKLLEFEVPEIYEKIVEIVNIVRQPGMRTKIVVKSNNPKVDPVGACVGVRGSRIKPIINELHGEHIDFIHYSDNIVKFITDAFSPAKISTVNIIDEQQKIVEVIVPDNFLGMAIGKNGTNVNLVTKLTGWTIDVKSETEKQQEQKSKKESTVEELLKIKGVGEKLASILLKEGYNSIEKIANARVELLNTLQGVGEKKAEKIIEAAKKMLKTNETKKENNSKNS